MFEESISQAEIDALVRGVSGPAPAAPAAGQDDTALLREALREFAGHAGSALSELVGAPCSGALVDVTATNVQGASSLTSGQILIGRSTLSGGLNGPVYYIVPMSLGLAMITQIYGGVAPSAMDDSAIGALADGLMQMNQVGLARLSDSLVGRPILAGSIEVTITHASSLTELGGMGPDNLVNAASIDMRVGDGTGRVIMILPQEVAAPLVKAVQEKKTARSSQPALVAASVPVQSMSPAYSVPAATAAPPPAAYHATVAAAVAPAAVPVAYQPAKFPDLAPKATREDIRNIDLLMDVTLQVTVELGRTRKQIREVLSLGPGSVLELDKLAGEQVDVLVNGKLIAKGEVVVIDENYGVRITDILSPVERVQSLR